MSNLKIKIILNGLSAVFLQLSMVPLNFVLRLLLLEYIGVEIIGISNTIVSMVGLLSLAEGGVGSAIAYCLYKPLVEKNESEINEYMSVFKRLYIMIAAFVGVAGSLLALSLPYILKGVEINAFVYGIFFLECANSVMSYLLCYRRTLLCVDMKGYIANNVDLLCNVVFVVAGLLVIYFSRNYLLYMLILVLRTVTANVIIHHWCGRLYPFLEETKFCRDKFHQVVGHAKNLLAGNVGAYVFNSTDNLVISMATNTVNVGYLSNYNMITNYLQKFSLAALSGAAPAVGQKQVNSSVEDKRKLLYRYTQLCYLLAAAVCVPTYMLIDYFVVNMYGERYLMEAPIGFLLVLILYLYIVPTPYGTFIVTSGHFVISKQADYVAAIINLLCSVVFVNIYGLPGVLWGTVCGMFVAWGMRARFVLQEIMEFSRRQMVLYVFKMGYSMFLVVLAASLGVFVFKYIIWPDFWVQFIFMALIAEAITFVVYICLYRFSDRVSFGNICKNMRRYVSR